MSPLSINLTSGLQQTSEMLILLLARVAAKDRKAFAALYQATHLKLYGVAIRILRQAALAEDILQDAYVKIWERAGDFDGKRGSAITWMTVIVRNRALDEVRRSTFVMSAEDITGIDDIADDKPLASDLVERSEEHVRLGKCLSALEDEKRTMVLLAYHHGASREALAQKFGHPVATIKTWLRRSLESLKQCLES